MAASHGDTHSAPAHEPPRHTVALGFGFIIGLAWVAMAVVSLVSAAKGYGNHRYDWGLTWGLIGLLLLGAGLAAMVGTWWHLTRVRNDH